MAYYMHEDGLVFDYLSNSFAGPLPNEEEWEKLRKVWEDFRGTIVHDSVVVTVPAADHLSLEKIRECMAYPLPPNLPPLTLKAEANLENTWEDEWTP